MFILIFEINFVSATKETIQFLTFNIFDINAGKFLFLKNIHWIRVVANLLHCSTQAPSSKKRSKATLMYGIGSTITATKWPRFLYEGTCHILPRPYKPCKPYGEGWFLMKSQWFIDLVNKMEKYVMFYLETVEETYQTKKIISELKEVKSIVPKCLRLSNTCFTQLSITTSDGEEDMEIHIDEGDIINAVFHLGIVKSGGSTLYFTTNRKEQKMLMRHDIPFEHGRVQIGLFNKIYHCAQSFQGIRFALNFNVKKKILEHFQKHGNRFYDQLIDNNYKGELLIAR